MNREARDISGLRAKDVLDVVESGIGGVNVSTAIEGRERIPIQVGWSVANAMTWNDSAIC
ncbi:MAG: hypothetical protein WDM76_07675 [Limisphaerales bacterium]